MAASLFLQGILRLRAPGRSAQDDRYSVAPKRGQPALVTRLLPRAVNSELLAPCGRRDPPP